VVLGRVAGFGLPVTVCVSFAGQIHAFSRGTPWHRRCI
jgi:hypothetical protein